MIAALCVGAGGFCGAIARYLLGLLPYQGQFPLITFVINFTGAVAIGAVVEAASVRPGMLGSVSFGVLRATDVPVLTVK